MNLHDVPIFPLQTVLFPGGPLHLRIFETRYTDMVSRCLKVNSPFAVSSIITGDETTTHEFQGIGTLATITDFESQPDGLLGIVAKGGERVRILDHTRQEDGLYLGTLAALPREPASELPDGYAGLACLLRELLGQLPEIYGDIENDFGNASWVGYRLSEILPIGLAHKQQLLEMEDSLRRLQILHPLLEALRSEGLAEFDFDLSDIDYPGNQ